MILIWVCIFHPSLAQERQQKEYMQEILAKLDAGESIENMVINLSDINFATGTAQLEPVASSYLEQVVRLMEMAPNIDLFIQGHADNTGSDALNDRLSLNRAQSVQDFLAQRGIAVGRLSVQGFGSSKPVASNETAEGRALNRRVEMEVLKREEAETIQDIIVLRNRERIGSRVLDFNDANIRYQQFSSEDTLLIKTDQVDTIYFADGAIKVFRHNEQKKGFSEWWKENMKIFQESEAFHKGNFVIGLGTGISNVGVGYREYQVNIPPAFFVVELPVGYNIGVGATAGAMHWQNPEDEAFRYSYYAVSTRVAYHFNLGKKWDVYAGIALTGRRVTKEYEGISIYRQEIDPGMLLGVRYYLNNNFGFFAEIGDESVANPRAGLTLKFGN